MKRFFHYFKLILILAFFLSCKEKDTKSAEKEILSFVLTEKTSDAIINSEQHKVDAEVQVSTNLTHLAPVITVSPGASIDPASGTEIDFSTGPVKFVISASDGTSKDWIVKVTRIPYSGPQILAFTISGQTSTEDAGTRSLRIIMPSGTDFSSLTPVITVSAGATISPVSGYARDFSEGPVSYTVTAENGTTSTWSVLVTHALIAANDPNIQYTGRIDFRTPAKPKFANPGVNIKAKFIGTFCDIEIQDESNYNYIEVIIDDQEPVRILAGTGRKTYRVVKGLPDEEHTLLLCKDTEASIGSLTFFGFRCEELSALPDKPSRKIECYGNSITCGAKMITGTLCDQTSGSDWNISNKAYMSYGAIAARDLDAQWHLTSVSGIGLVQSCCDMGYTLPDVYDRLNLNSPSLLWDFDNYIPDVVTICLGQNDGTGVDSALFRSTYVAFIESLRTHYPDASIFCLTSPMADNSLFEFMKTCLSRVVNIMNASGDSKVYKVELPHNLNQGCQSHPNEEQHQQIADALEIVIKDKMGW
jgi:lysophospholipase L1-like esterase